MKNIIQKLYIDFDGTIVNTIKAIVDLYNNDFQYYKKFKKIHWTDINTWDFEELKCASKEYINIYFNQPRFFSVLEFMENARDVLEKLSKQYKIVVVSMGYRPNLVAKKKWIKKNIPFADFVGINYKKHSDKSHIDMSDGICIDDNEKHLHGNAKDYICYGDKYEWNKFWSGMRCNNWFDVYRLLNKQNNMEE